MKDLLNAGLGKHGPGIYDKQVNDIIFQKLPGIFTVSGCECKPRLRIKFQDFRPDVFQEHVSHGVFNIDTDILQSSLLQGG